MKITKNSPEFLLLLIAAGSSMGFAIWLNLLNNFAIDRAGFTGKEIGILQSLREIPGFLAFTIIYVLMFIREQRMAYVSLFILGVGTLLTGFFPSAIGFYVTTIIMSIGFHYLETVQNSLSLQWLDKKDAPEFLGKMIAAKSAAAIIAFSLVWFLFEWMGLDYQWIYFAGGGISIIIALYSWFNFSNFPQKVYQSKKLILRKRYWLFYALQFMGGARRQIFVVFAGFLMVEKFGFSVGEISMLYLINAVINIFLAPLIGKLVGLIGERRTLIFEYIGLIAIFIGYALVEDSNVAIGLYVLDHLFFAMAIAQKTYFQKIANPADIASTAGVSFTINHIAAVVIPVFFGVLWIQSPSLVFYIGAVMAGISLVLAFNVPNRPDVGNETIIGRLGDHTAESV